MNSLVDHLLARHALQAVLLYGSRARGTHRPGSDYDLLLIRAPGPKAPVGRDVHHHDDALVDAWLHDADALDPASDPGLLRLQGAQVLHDATGVAAALLARVDAVAAEGPPAMSPGDRAAFKVWLPKMLERLQGPDPLVAGHYRAELLHALLPTWCQARRRWYRGTRQTVALLRAEAPEVAATFEAALRADAPLEALRAAVDAVDAALDA